MTPGILSGANRMSFVHSAWEVSYQRGIISDYATKSLEIIYSKIETPVQSGIIFTVFLLLVLINV
jgi:hypothetical protein